MMFKISYRIPALLLILLGIMATHLEPAFSQQQALPPGMQLPRSAGSGPRTSETPIIIATLSTIQGIVEYYTLRHYSVIGPSKVVKIENSTISFVKFPEAKNYPKINLRGLNLTVRTQSGQPASLGNIHAGNKIMICKKDNKAVVIIMNKTQEFSNEN